MLIMRDTIDTDSKVAIIVTCHENYVKFLKKCLKYINSQLQFSFSEKILVLDSVSESQNPIGWEVVRGEYHNSNKARNAGLKKIKRSQWVIYWDADNIMPEDYLLKNLKALELNEDRRVAFFYPTISYRSPINISSSFDDSKQTLVLNPPDWSYWSMREKTYIDTSSLWNVDALRSVDGWSETQNRLDDWELSLRLTENGWIGKKSGVITNITDHHERKTKAPIETLNEALWNARSLGIVTLFGPKKDCFSETMNWYCEANIPPKTSIYWINNSDDYEFGNLLWQNAEWLKSRFRSITILDQSKPYLTDNHRDVNRHKYVAGLYNKILPRVKDDLILIMEDDNIAGLNDLRILSDNLPHNGKLAVIGGAYRSRSSPIMSCASRSVTHWRDCPRFDELPENPVKVGMIGGGFTLYKNAALRRVLPMNCINVDGGLIGWDGNVGKNLAKLGYEIKIHGGVKVKHLCKEVIEYEESLYA